MAILAGDIGGTKTLLQLTEHKHVIFEKRYVSAEYNNLLPMIEEFLNSAGQVTISKACFGIAGPIQGNSAQVTNLPWLIKAKELQQALAIDQVILINDFKAVAYSIDVIDDSDMLTLQQGKKIANAPRVVIGAGTGLGSAFLFHSGTNYDVYSSESSHAAFAPINDIQSELLSFLKKKYTQVSYEHIVSGPGLVNIFEFLRQYLNQQVSDELSQALRLTDQAAAISQFALTEKDPLAVQALDIFTQVYARQAANLALTSLAYGGVYIAGGIAPKIIKKLQQPEFIKHFNNNSTMGYLLQNMPLKVVMNSNAGLLGAAAYCQ